MSPHERIELVPEDELYELFETQRPQRDAFRAGIAERVAARNEANTGDAADEDGPVRSSFWRRAAAFLPIDPIGGAVAGSATGKVLGGKLLPAALAQFPHADRQHLRKLVRQARKEQETRQPPRASRLLFRYLRKLQEEPDYF